jgi:hypothetical protein
MKKFKLKFELLGFKLQTKVECLSAAQAKDCVRSRLKFYSVRPNDSIKNNYYVSADFYGKTINTQVNAQHEIEAKRNIVNLINFISCVEQKDIDVDYIKDFLGIK